MRVDIAIVLLLLPTALHAQAEKRIALLIGNKGLQSGRRVPVLFRHCIRRPIGEVVFLSPLRSRV